MNVKMAMGKLRREVLADPSLTALRRSLEFGLLPLRTVRDLLSSCVCCA